MFNNLYFIILQTSRGQNYSTQTITLKILYPPDHCSTLIKQKVSLSLLLLTSFIRTSAQRLYSSSHFLNQNGHLNQHFMERPNILNYFSCVLLISFLILKQCYFRVICFLWDQSQYLLPLRCVWIPFVNDVLSRS